MKSLTEIYPYFSTDVGDGDKGTLHTYIPIYSEILEKYRNKSVVFEIGVSLGYSIKMWMEYFTDSRIIGIELYPQFNNPRCMISELMEDKRCEIWIDDATNENILNKIGDTKIDVVIDDGSHHLNDQIKSFNLLKDKMNVGGVYIIEDIEDIQSSRNVFLGLHDNCEIIDNRHINSRYDDVLVIYRF